MFTVRVEDNITGVKAGVDPGSPGIGGALMAGNLGSKVEGGAGKVDVGSCTEMDGKPAGGPKVCNVLEAPPRREDSLELKPAAIRAATTTRATTALIMVEEAFVILIICVVFQVWSRIQRRDGSCHFVKVPNSTGYSWLHDRNHNTTSRLIKYTLQLRHIPHCML
jgi:hypothetical protein